MSVEDERIRRSRRLQRAPPEIFGTPSLQLRGKTDQRVEPTMAANKSEDVVVIHSKTPSVISKLSGKLSMVSKATTSNSEVARMKLNAEIESMRRIGKAEDELLLARLEREKQIEKKRLEMEKLKIDEEYEDDFDDIASVEEVVSVNSEPDTNDRINSWIQNEHQQLATNDSGTEIISTMNHRLEKLLSRQSVPKELPSFSGNPEEWPMFYQQFHRTTELCGLSMDENLLRLQKCLKGKARDAVMPILGIPENLPMIMETLQLMFGRSDQIIKTMINNVKATTAPSKSKPDSIILFSNLVGNLVATMKSLRRTGQTNNPQLLEELVVKLPVEQQFQWCGIAKRLKSEPTLQDFQTWLSDVAMTASLMPVTFNSQERNVDVKKRENKKIFLVSTEKDGKKCFHCSSAGHKLEECKSFLDADIQNRWKTVKANRVCYCCLSPGHRSDACRKKAACDVENCGRLHNKLLHKSTLKPSKNEKTEERETTEYSGHVNEIETKIEVLLRILPVKLYGPRGVVTTFAMLDEGYTVTMIESSSAEKLELIGDVDPLCVSWTNEVSREEPNSRRVSIEITGVGDAKKQFRLKNFRTVTKMALPSQTVDMKNVKEKWLYLADIPFDSIQNAQPLLLIGSDNILLTIARKIRQGHWNDPIASKTWLGWVVHGNLPKSQSVRCQVSLHLCEKVNIEDELTQMIKASFSTESFGLKVVNEMPRSKDDQRALLILEATTTRVGNRFQTGLLWKSDNIRLPESRSNAMRRLLCMERKMDRDLSFREAYCEKIVDYVSKGYCRKLSKEEIIKKGPRTYYIPHFAVFNPNKPGKLRLGFDAAARSHGMSLNDSLLKGQDLLNPLPAVLMRFRRHRIGIVGDIREMFHQVKIIPTDVDSQRFLWRGKNRLGEPDEYVMQVMIFGASCSPASALFVKDMNSSECSTEFPDTSKSIIENTYMDDYLHGASSHEVASQKIAEAIEVFAHGGFHICNWSSSSKKAIVKLPPEMRAKNLVEIAEETTLPTERVLGLRWNADADKFVFEINFPKVKTEVLNCQRPPTKREMASLVMSIYDPLGLVVQFTIKGRILFQEAWLLKTGWDEPISEELFLKWKWWVGELVSITNVQVPRCYSSYLGETTSTQLHIMVDASSKAF